MPANYYLQLPGIVGCSKNPKHRGWIDLLSLRLGNHRGIRDSGRESARSSFDEVTVEKALDTSSPDLFQACIKGTSFDAVVEGVDAKERVCLKYTLKGAILHSFRPGQAQSGGCIEEIQINFTSIRADHY